MLAKGRIQDGIEDVAPPRLSSAGVGPFQSGQIHHDSVILCGDIERSDVNRHVLVGDRDPLADYSGVSFQIFSDSLLRELDLRWLVRVRGAW